MPPVRNVGLFGILLSSALALCACQGDDNSLPLPPADAAADGHSGDSGSHDGGGEGSARDASSGNDATKEDSASEASTSTDATEESTPDATSANDAKADSSAPPEAGGSD